MKFIPDRFANYLIGRFDKILLEKYPEYAKLKSGQKKLERALTAAKRIQKATLPKEQPNFPGYDIYGDLESYYMVGGDFYDFHPKENKLGIALGDISGKGLEAAMLSSSVHAALHAFTETNQNGNIDDTFFRLNNFLLEHSDGGMFATLMYGDLKDNGEFNYCSAGHEPPILFSEGKAKEIVRKGTKNINTVLGILPEIGYDILSLNLQKGDIMMFYSDGVTDPISMYSERKFGTETLAEILENNHQKTSKQIVDEVFSYMGKFKKTDDRTVIVVKREND